MGLFEFLFVNFGWSRKFSAIVVSIVGLVLILGAFYLALDAYGDARYDAGKEAADKAWREAAVALAEQSEEAAGAADEGAGDREAAYAAKLIVEREKVDATISDGGDPFDVMFPSDGM